MFWRLPVVLDEAVHVSFIPPIALGRVKPRAQYRLSGAGVIGKNIRDAQARYTPGGRDLQAARFRLLQLLRLQGTSTKNCAARGSYHRVPRTARGEDSAGTKQERVGSTVEAWSSAKDTTDTSAHRTPSGTSRRVQKDFQNVIHDGEESHVPHPRGTSKREASEASRESISPRQRPRAREARQAENRRAWQKKCRLRLLEREPPSVPPAIQEEAEREVSSNEYPRIFNQFLEGRESIRLEAVDVEVKDFEGMMGMPPFPETTTSLSDFSGEWPILSAALHGIMSRQCLEYCKDLILRCRTLSEEHIIGGLDAKYRDLVVRFNQSAIYIRRFSEAGDEAGVAIATLNNRWIARLIVYTAQDIGALREGCSSVVHVVSERMRAVGQKRQERHGTIE
ncbi:hypothetical protein FA13DRAFT_1718717 [Coprinellus micaceus]|uniref:Uncharacterized protein n=1 Tax=Coprinellus micaceus TaxID=71717 RepID=A0A4Y7SCS0_COPMI|nr:hypothetical protein FA13DRAFT_1718717 [Coprinellus micaceus]